MDEENEIQDLLLCKKNILNEEEALLVFKRICRQLDHKDNLFLDLNQLKLYCYNGYCNKYLRPKYWKLFLGYFPKNKFKYDHFIKSRRKHYKFYYENAIRQKNIKLLCDRIINNDIDRTILFPFTVKENNVEKIHCKFLDSDNSSLNFSSSHRDSIKRILLTYKITNSSIGYVQGMNMILIPIYYVMINSIDEEDRLYAEEDSFFCFYNLMAEIGENFMQDMDFDKENGIRSKMNNVFKLLKLADSHLYNSMEEKGLLNNFFHFRWISLLLSHEFSLDKVILLWDKFLSDYNRFEMVTFCAVSILIDMKDTLICSDFETCMVELQSCNKKNIDLIFKLADKLRNELRNMLN
ncbi:Rab-GTPase-TBC domain-containing protein [Hamiltosporidium magnivora]|uniref:Rab-GTPase-TBC domain-containing protein n=1 Tax=Hamiltosporidium magnivora TaxID=148818 RepID=A0A4Q9LKJ3_9MICR|nr:Rab-GTPase-TBC domain-containing protein [Hamiltosporidium magnivora]